MNSHYRQDKQDAVTAHFSDTVVPEAAESVGAWLSRVRVSQGADPQQMARQIGLNPLIIQALESNNFAQLGASVFVRGYLARYARLLNLPEAAVLERYQHQSGARQELPPLKVVHTRQRETRLWDLRGAFYLAAVVGLGWAAISNLPSFDPAQALRWWRQDGATSAPTAATSAPGARPITTQVHYPFQAEATEATAEAAPSAPAGQPSSTTPTAQPDNTTTPTATLVLTPPPVQTDPPVAFSLAPAPTGSSPASALTAASSRPQSTSTAPSPTESAAATIPVSATATVTTSDSTTVSTEAGGVRLMLQFSDECWVEVKDAQGKVLVNGLMRANTSQTLSGPAPFTVTLGNAPAARIALDDQPVDTAVYMPRRGTVSRFTLTP